MERSLVANRNTRQRKAIRDAIQIANRPVSPEEILSAAQDEHPGLGIATVYRAIKSLLDEEWLVAVDLPGEATRYELSGKEHHHHFHCRSCGTVYEVNGCIENLRRMAPRGFQIFGHDVTLWGACAKCTHLKKKGQPRSLDG